MDNYSIKWKIELSNSYKEYLLNLMAQGYFGEIWEEVQRNKIQALDIFMEEIHNIQWQFVGDNFIVTKGGSQFLP